MHARPSSRLPAWDRIPRDWAAAAPVVIAGLVPAAGIAWVATGPEGRTLGGPVVGLVIAGLVLAITAWAADRAMRRQAWRAFADATFGAVAGDDEGATWYAMKGDLAAIRRAAVESLAGEGTDNDAEAMGVDPGSRDEVLGRLADRPTPILLVANLVGYSLWRLPDPMARAYPAAERLAGDQWEDVPVVTTRVRIFQTSRAVGREPVIWIGRRGRSPIDLAAFGWVSGPAGRAATQIASELDRVRAGDTGVWAPSNASRRSSNRTLGLIATVLGSIVGSVGLAWLVLFVITRLA